MWSCTPKPNATITANTFANANPCSYPWHNPKHRCLCQPSRLVFGNNVGTHPGTHSSTFDHCTKIINVLCINLNIPLFLSMLLNAKFHVYSNVTNSCIQFKLYSLNFSCKECTLNHHNTNLQVSCSGVMITELLDLKLIN